MGEEELRGEDNFTFLFLVALWHMEFQGQGSDLSHSCTYTTTVATPDPLTHC